MTSQQWHELFVRLERRNQLDLFVAEASAYAIGCGVMAAALHASLWYYGQALLGGVLWWATRRTLHHFWP